MTLGIFASYYFNHVVNKPLQNLLAYNKQHLNFMPTGWGGYALSCEMAG